MNALYEKLVALWPALEGTSPWALFALFVLLLIIVGLLMKLLFFSGERDDTFTRYTKDNVFDVVWTWEYRKKSPFSITCLCPKCGKTLFYDEHRTSNAEGVEVSLECEKCDRILTTQDGTYTSLLKRVQNHIERNMATGKWR